MNRPRPLVNTQPIKAGILPNCSCICNTARLHHLESKKNIEKKLDENSARVLRAEQILEAATNKIVAV